MSCRGLHGEPPWEETAAVSNRFSLLKNVWLTKPRNCGERAQAMPPGVEKDALLRRARQAEAGTHVSERSPGL